MSDNKFKLNFEFQNDPEIKILKMEISLHLIVPNNQIYKMLMNEWMKNILTLLLLRFYI